MGDKAMIDPKKLYRTRDGREVRIYATDGANETVHGAVKNPEGWVMCHWLVHSGLFCNHLFEHHFDLIEVKPRIQREVWVNVYPHNASYFRNREAADANALDNRIACVKFTIDCEEGEGL